MPLLLLLAHHGSPSCMSVLSPSGPIGKDRMVSGLLPLANAAARFPPFSTHKPLKTEVSTPQISHTLTFSSYRTFLPEFCLPEFCERTMHE